MALSSAYCTTSENRNVESRESSAIYANLFRNAWWCNIRRSKPTTSESDEEKKMELNGKWYMCSDRVTHYVYGNWHITTKMKCSDNAAKEEKKKTNLNVLQFSTRATFSETASKFVLELVQFSVANGKKSYSFQMHATICKYYATHDAFARRVHCCKFITNATNELV